MICVRSNPCPAPQEDAWITSYQRLVPHWHSVSLSHQHSTISISISRVNQFDAARLDIEMSAMLKEQLVKVFSLMKDKSLSSKEDDSICPICRASPTLAYLALPCQHRYCYYCLRTRFAAVPSFQCSRCGEPVVAMQQHGSVVT